ncbi:uncharacterized protein isoform X2 [Leptinotarsa decemlineata]|uniref:uncharacterized protein isoform X2 n=1 Tax=Leptinotarsa decemlineata TaxID=7539 RepID=UPI003D3058EB
MRNDKELQGRYATRTMSSNNTDAIDTLTSPCIPRGGSRRKPRKKLPFPPARLLGAMEDPPEPIQDILEDLPLGYR